VAAKTDAEYREILARATQAFVKYPNVHAVGLGAKSIGGKITPGPAILVLVEKKLPLSQLKPEEVVPTEFEGVPTDLLQVGRPVPAVAPPGIAFKGDAGPYVDDWGRYRPLRGGIRITPNNTNGSGTMGFLARLDLPTPHTVGVTNMHVMFSSPATAIANLRVGQPTNDTSMTHCCDNLFGQYAAGVWTSSMDVAIVQLDGGTEYYAQIEEIGVVSGVYDLSTADGASGTYAVRKRGARTGLTGGIVRGIHFSPVGATKQNYMLIQPNPLTGPGTPTFDWRGDSGSAIVNDSNEIVGLLWGVDPAPTDTDFGWGFAWGIQDVLDALETAGFPIIAETATTLDDKRVAAGPVPQRSESQVLAPPPIARRLESDLALSDEGRKLTELWLRHSKEMHALVTRNRRVAVQWQRTGGAALLQTALRSAYAPEVMLPVEIGGRSLDVCIHDVLDLFARHGSIELRADLARCRALLPSMAGRTYAQIVAGLAEGAAHGEQSWPA
jgi:hypothetical protein